MTPPDPKKIIIQGAAKNTTIIPGTAKNTTMVRTVGGQSVPVNITSQTMTVKDSNGVVSECPFKVLKMETPINVTAGSSKTVFSSTHFSNGDFIKDITKKDNKDCIWQVDGMNLLQKFVAVKDEKTGKTLYKSSFTYDGLNALNTSRFQKISATIVNKVKNETFVQVLEELNPLDVKVKAEPISEDEVTSSQPPPVIETKPFEVKPAFEATSSTTSESVPVPLPESPNIVNYKNTFKDDFLVYLQTLISQYLDVTFLRTVYKDDDKYFIDKIKIIDDVLEGKKYSLMSLPSFPNNDRLLYAIHTYPIVEEKQLPAIKMENFNCVGCELNMQENPVFSTVCLELQGEPYERNTLIDVKLLVDVDEDYKVLRVCASCCKIIKLYSKMCHAKYLLFKQCQKSVNKIKEKEQTKDMPPYEIITSLLHNEPWVETKLLQLIKDWVTIDDLRKEF